MSNDRGRAWVEIDLDALVANAHRILRRVNGTSLIPMVKADAYGLGLRPVVDALRAGLPAAALHGFGVATIAEGEALRDHGYDGRVIVFSPVSPSELSRMVAASLELTVSSFAQIDRCLEAGRAGMEPLAVHTEVDTGMGRAGFTVPDDAPRWVREMRARMGDQVRWAGCFTHFHSADADALDSCDEQWERFRPVCSELRNGEGGPTLHACNSAAAMRRPEYALAAVRPGIFMYGGRVGADEPPEPVAHVRARIGLVADADPGRTVGYGAEYRASAAERWATVQIGYGDGVPRALWRGGGRFLLRGRPVPVIGRISMDVAVVDITGMDDVEEGEIVTVLGRDRDELIPVDEVAGRCGTISYEILTGLTGRLPRIYQP